MRKLLSISSLVALLAIASAQGTRAQKIIIAGPYPNGGTWAELHDINNSGVAMGWGDVANGDTRMIAVSLADPRNPKWFDSGLDSDDTWWTEGGGVSQTGLIAGHINSGNGDSRAYVWAWTPNGPVGTDLGTLPNDDGSAAIAINNSGTLIVGNSYHYNADRTNWWPTPVVWTPTVKSHNGRLMVTWVIHALPTGGLEQPGRVFENAVLNNWSGWGVNDLGQIVGDAWTDNYDEIAVIWNPSAGGRGWEVQQLPHRSSGQNPVNYAYTEALSINNQGEIVGDLSNDSWNTQLAALWKVSFPMGLVWKLIVLPSLSGTQEGASIAWGINDLGEALGVSLDANGNEFATMWSAKDPSKAVLVGFPGVYSRAMQMNKFGIVVGRNSNVSSSGPYQAVAVALH